jgi:hypothetical protein
MDVWPQGYQTLVPGRRRQRLPGVKWSPLNAGGDMSSPAGKFVSEASETYKQKPDEISSYMQIAKLEPQELMRFLEFCLGKIHEEENSGIGESTSKRIQ